MLVIQDPGLLGMSDVTITGVAVFLIFIYFGAYLLTKFDLV